MGKKGGRGKGGGAAANSNNSTETEAPRRASGSDDAAATQQPQVPEQQQQQQQQAEGSSKPVQDLSVEELRAELQAARAELATLRAAQSQGPRSSTADKLGALQPQDVQELQDKLQALRKEQQEADAARDKAWKQLKTVVQEISSLANPDWLQSMSVPKAQ